MPQSTHTQKKSLTTTDNIHLYYETRGENKKKPTLVLLHGLGGDLTAWNHERDVLHNHGFGTLAIDLRGHGLSDKPEREEAYALDRFAKDIYEIIEKEQLTNPIVVGHCFGGIVAIKVASTPSFSLKGLALVDTSYKTPYISSHIAGSVFVQKMLAYIAKYAPLGNTKEHVDFDQFKHTPDIDVERLVSDITHTSLKSYLYILKHLTNYDASVLLNKIRVPTIIVHGSDDHIIPLAIAKKLHQQIQHSSLEIVPKANHIIVISKPNTLSEILLKYTQQLTAHK